MDKRKLAIKKAMSKEFASNPFAKRMKEMNEAKGQSREMGKMMKGIPKSLKRK